MSSGGNEKKGIVYLLQEFSVPLIAGVFAALILANVNNDLYRTLVHAPIYELPGMILSGDYGEHAAAPEDGEAQSEAGNLDGEQAAEAHESDAGGHGSIWSHVLTLHFLIDDIFMVFFFGIAAKEITEACSRGGALNPPSKAINPLLGTLGGVAGPIAVYFVLNKAIGDPAWAKGWGIPTATDIALAWLVARMVFGQGHPAISFLLLLAVADDAIGLVIIAIFYPDPSNPTIWANTWWIGVGMFVAWMLRRNLVIEWWPYILFGGMFCWWGLYSAHLHPALALVPIVPFLPGPEQDIGLFQEEKDYAASELLKRHSPLEQFEHQLKSFVDFGLFFFAFANAGVPFANIHNLTWIVLCSLLFGKVIGITGFSWIGSLAGFALPDGMKVRHLFVASIVAGIGLTVALFVAGQAFVDANIQGAAKMGALFSGGITIVAFVAGRALRVKDGAKANTKSAQPAQ